MGEDQAVHYGSADIEDVRALSGLELLHATMARRLPAPPIGEALGFMLAEAEPGRVRFEGRASERLFNPLGSIHGGFALALIDSAAGCAVHTELGPGIGYTTVETKANFVRPVPVGALVHCEGRVVSRGRTIATAEAFLRTDAGKLLAHGTSTLIILGSR